MTKQEVEDRDFDDFEDEAAGENSHGFILEVNKGKYFDNDFVLQCTLPEFAISSKQGQTTLEGPTSILVTMIHGPGVAANLIKACREEELDFKIHLTTKDEVYSTWKLRRARIGGVRFGQMSKPPLTKPEEDFIQCEVIFYSTEVDGEAI